jgi:ribosomal protein S12 methylthiotransferase
MEFVEETQFERVGVFTYSPQEGTRAALLVDDVPEQLKLERLERLTALQRAITAERYESRIGSRVRALVERSATTEDGEPVAARARLPWQADDIDGVTWLDVDAPAGSFVEVEVTDVIDDYDFEAKVLSIVEQPAAAPRARPSRELPMATIGSFGR